MSSPESGMATADDPSEKGGEATPYNDSTNGAGTNESLDVRVDHLEAYMEQYVEGFLENELLRRIEAVEAENAELRTMLDSLSGIKDGEPTSPKQRAIDLGMSLIKRAQNRADEDRYAMWHQDVADALIDHGHGPPVYNQWSFDAMDAVAKADGFGQTKITNPDGREVKAVTVNLAKLPSQEPSDVSNDIITGMEAPGPNENTEDNPQT